MTRESIQYWGKFSFKENTLTNLNDYKFGDSNSIWVYIPKSSIVQFLNFGEMSRPGTQDVETNFSRQLELNMAKLTYRGFEPYVDGGGLGRSFYQLGAILPGHEKTGVPVRWEDEVHNW